MVDHDDLKDRLQLIRVMLENASCVSPRERDFWTSLIAEIIAISESFGVAAQVVGRVEAAQSKQLTINSPYGNFTY